MAKVLSIIDKTCRFLSSINVVFMIGVVALQVFARFLLPSCPSWTEELSRIFYIYIIGLAAPIALRNDLLVNVDIIINALPPKAVLALRIFNRIVVFAVCAVMAYASYGFMLSGLREKSVALVWPMVIPFTALFICGVLMTLFCAECIIKDCMRLKEARRAQC